MQSSNPIFNQDSLNNVQALESAPMTVGGAINKTFILLLLAAVAAAAVWYQAILGYADKVSLIMGIGMVVGLITGFVIIFKQNTAPYLAPVYAFAEGAFIGGISAFMEAQFPGIVIQAIALSMIAVFSMLLLFKTRIIRATEKFRSTLIVATFSVMVLYLVNLIGSFFHFSIPFINGGGMIGIAFSVIVVLIAAFNLIIDFDFIEQGAQNMFPKHYEWYGAFGLMVTLVWMYIEILRLLSKLRDN